MRNIKTVLLVLIALAIGLAAGYLLFGGNQSMNITEEAHDHSAADEMTSASDGQIWTCSMHPQIQQDEPGSCPLCGMDLIPLNTNTSDDPLVLEMTESAVKLANIQTTIVGESPSQSEKTIRLSGKVKADERLSSSLVAHVSGRIEKLFVTFTGEKVTKGQKIATLYSPELITAQRELLEALKLTDLNPNLVVAARNKLKYWKIDDEAIAAIEQNGGVQETFTLYADESGIVKNRRVSVGDHLMEGQPLFDLINLSKVWVLFDAYEEDLLAIKIGNRIEFSTPSILNRTFRTRVTFIDPVLNPDTRIASIRTEINNAYGLLKPEMFVTGQLQSGGSRKTQLTAPKSAVLWTGIRSVVYVKLPETNIPSFQFREVELGESTGDAYHVVSGLEAGEEVVTYGSFTIDAAAQLNNQMSMMNKNVKLKGGGISINLPDYTETAPLEFKDQLAKVSNAYLTLKDALVDTDRGRAKNAAKIVVTSLGLIDVSLLEGDARLYWMEQLSGLEAHSQKISVLDDIEEQREQFDYFSQPLIKSIKVFGVADDKLYIEHCPMAFNNKGADWLSREKTIRNPYFGDKMMTCGVVKDTITKDYKNPQLTSFADIPKMKGHNH